MFLVVESKMAPRIDVWFPDGKETYEPGDVLECRYRIVDPGEMQFHSLEASVLWYTEGKGEEDLLVNRFERRVASSNRNELLQEQVIRATLPNSPLSYEGVIVKLIWCVRIKAFAPKGKELLQDRIFRLGKIPPAKRLEESHRVDIPAAPAEPTENATESAM
jgi:hypothetical protein